MPKTKPYNGSSKGKPASKNTKSGKGGHSRPKGGKRGKPC
jgi:hypothetical protein